MDGSIHSRLRQRAGLPPELEEQIREIEQVGQRFEQPDISSEEVVSLIRRLREVLVYEDASVAGEPYRGR